MNPPDLRSGDLFATIETLPGALGCRVEIAATMREALARTSLSRDQVVDKMAYHLGERFSLASLDGYVAPSHGDKAESPRDVPLLRAMAFDAALGQPVLFDLWCRKSGLMAVSSDDAALLEWARLHHEEREIAERKRALEVSLKLRRGK